MVVDNGEFYGKICNIQNVVYLTNGGLMLYTLLLVVFMNDGSEHRIDIKKDFTDHSCIDNRDMVRSYLDRYNNLEDKGDVDFVDAECSAQIEFI